MPVTVHDLKRESPVSRPTTARVAVVRTRPETVVADDARVMDLAGYRDTLRRDGDTLIKLNLSFSWATTCRRRISVFRHGNRSSSGGTR